jgi:hypothetical protein
MGENWLNGLGTSILMLLREVEGVFLFLLCRLCRYVCRAVGKSRFCNMYQIAAK